MKKIVAFLLILLCISGCIQKKLILFEGKDGLSGYKDEQDHVVIQPKYIFAEPFSKYGIAPVCDVKEGWKYIDRNEKLIIKPYYIKNSNDFDRFSEGLARYQANGKMGFFNENGKIVIEAKYEFASTFKNGMAAVAKNVQWEKYDEMEFIKIAKAGFINKKGELIIPYQYDNVIELFNKKETATVIKDGKKILINPKGKVLKELPE